MSVLKNYVRPMKAILGKRQAWRPLILSHLITSRCNAACPFCLWKGESPELSTEEVKRLYSQAGELGLLSVVIWGGEPLLRNDLPEVLEAAHSSGLRTTVITNGYFLPERVDEIGPHLSSLLVSIDAPSVYHDQLRRLEGTFHRAREGVGLMRTRYKKVKVVIISCITRQNLGHVGPLLEFSHKERLPIVFQAINTRDYGLNPRPIDAVGVCPTREENQRAFRLIKEGKIRGLPVVNSYDYLNAFISGEVSYRCHYKRLVLRVDTNGDVLDCTRGEVIANVRQSSLAETIKSPLYQGFLKESEGCSVCMDAGTLEASFLWELRPHCLLNAVRYCRGL